MSAPAASQAYLLALGSNRRHHRFGAPRAVLASALESLDRAPLRLVDASAVLITAPLGPSARRYANAAAIVETMLAPPALLAHLKAIEQHFGRRRRGRRWGARVLDLDIILWSGGAWSSRGLGIPHAQFRYRRFVITPAAAIASRWRDPATALTVAQVAARLTRPVPARN